MIMLICNTCLSTDRTLSPLSKFEELIKETKILKLDNMTGHVCWECQHMMEKISKFKKRALKAQQQLKTTEKIENLTSLSPLHYELKCFYDADYYYTLDPLTNSEVETKTEVEMVKEEDVPDSIDQQDNKSDADFEDEKPELTEDIEVMASSTKTPKPASPREHIYVEPLEKSPEKVKKKNITKKSDEEEVMKKFTTVVYSEEEMVKKREEKRNQPNFKKIPYKCDLCVLGFTRKETYEEHLEKKHDESIGPLQCDVCHVRFATDKSVSRHRRQHYISYSCKFCKYNTSQLWSALNHCRTKHGADTSDSVHCMQCETVARTPEELAEHIKTKHTLSCTECGEKFKGKNTLRTHKVRIHGVKRQFICDICSKSFKSRSRLESHLSRHSPALASRLAYCASCRVQYKNIYVYRNHLRNSAHHAETQYPCPECNKKFASKVYWTKHYNFYHLQKSQYSCDICNKLFISDWRLKNHKQKHHGLSRSRDHACNVCGKKFYTVSTLRGHELTHSEQRSYMCEDCGDTFKQRPALYTHARLVHRAKKT